MAQSNILLDAFPRKALKALEGRLEHIKLETKQVMHETDKKITHVYFPTDGVISIVNEPYAGQVVEVATVGREGMVGIPVILGGSAMPSKAFVQVPGEAFRLPSADLIRAMKQDHAVRDILLRHVLALMNQIAQSASCNRLHEVQERCARWLLQTHDRVSSDTFPLTQEFLGQMLGVHRPTVSVAAGMLQRAGLIEYSRGVITILDRKGLEDASCQCYKLIAKGYRRMLKR